MSSTDRTLEPLRPPSGAPSRLTSLPFPRYSYVPRLMPHPVTHPDGHSHGVRDQPVELGSRQLPRDWHRVEEYLYGIDLFNAAFFWEAHESWEAVWHAVDRESVTGRYLQGLIQAAAALLQRHCGRLEGAGNLQTRAGGHLAKAREWSTSSGAVTFMGIDVGDWQKSHSRYLADESSEFPFLRPVFPAGVSRPGAAAT